MSRSNFLKHIKSLSEEELRNELKLLYGRFKEVKKFYAMELGDLTDRQKIFTKAKKDISNLYLIRGLHRKRPRVQKLNKLFSELKKNAVLEHELIDVYLYSAEHGITHILESRSNSEPVFNHTAKCLSEAFRLMKEAVLVDHYASHIHRVSFLAEPLHFISKHIRQVKEELGIDI